jgi:hypothetical protein
LPFSATSPSATPSSATRYGAGSRRQSMVGTPGLTTHDPSPPAVHDPC